MDFTVDVLKSRLPFPDIDQDIPTATLPKDTLDLYRAFDQIVALAGTTAKTDTEAQGYAYKNMDGNWTNNQEFLYVLITPNVPGAATTWKISLTVERDIGK